MLIIVMEYKAEKIDVKDMPKELKEAFINSLRNKRNTNLAETDKYMFPDFPITEKHKTEMILYRQRLRDFMNSNVINVDNISDDVMNLFPLKPDFMKT